jgi:type VI protein secretion system component VasF
MRKDLRDDQAFRYAYTWEKVRAPRTERYRASQAVFWWVVVATLATLMGVAAKHHWFGLG